MPRRGWAGLIVFVAAISLPACSSGRAKDETFAARPPDPALRGRFFATAGESESLSDLYDVQFSPLRLYRLTETQRIGAIGGCPSALVVTNADRTVGLTDTIQVFADKGLAAMEGLQDPKGSLPTLAADCRMLFTQVDRSTTPPTIRLKRFDPTTRAASELYAAGLLGVPDWGPGGRVAVFEGRLGDGTTSTVTTGIVIISPDGTKRTIPAPVPQFGTIQWGASKWMAIADEGKGTVFLDPDSGARTDLPGWVPLAWSPDGQRLIVAAAQDRKTLGLVDTASLTSVRTVGTTSKVAVFDLVWLPPDATAGGPMTVGRRLDDGR